MSLTFFNWELEQFGCSSLHEAETHFHGTYGCCSALRSLKELLPLPYNSAKCFPIYCEWLKGKQLYLVCLYLWHLSIKLVVGMN